MKDLISRGKLLDSLPKNDTVLSLDVRRIVMDAPAVDAAPVVHGRWLNNGIHGSVLCRCSECHYDAAAYSFRYCPMCGAKMDGEGAVKCQN